MASATTSNSKAISHFTFLAYGSSKLTNANVGILGNVYERSLKSVTNKLFYHTYRHAKRTADATVDLVNNCNDNSIIRPVANLLITGGRFPQIMDLFRV